MEEGQGGSWCQRKKRTSKEGDSRRAWGATRRKGHRRGKNSPKEGRRERERERETRQVRRKIRWQFSGIDPRFPGEGRGRGWVANEHKAVHQKLRTGMRKVKSARKNLSSAALNSRRVLKQSDGAVSKHFPSDSKSEEVERTNGQTYLSLVRRSNNFLGERTRPEISVFPSAAFNHNRSEGI